MKADFSRVTFDPLQRYSRVLMQQGRVQVDADWNEQVAVLLHHVRSLAADLIGVHGGTGESFAVLGAADDFLISFGHYYVSGILCENDQGAADESTSQGLHYSRQPNYPEAEPLRRGGRYLVYLDVWERQVTYLENATLRESALGGPDTATRAQIVWQVKVRESQIEPEDARDYEAFLEELGETLQPGTGGLQARARVVDRSTLEEPCTLSPEASYRGAANQLYRVEIHDGGRLGQATFKWSRDNGSVVFPIRRIDGQQITVGHLGRERRDTLEVGHWVEAEDRTYALHGRTDELLRVESVDRENLRVTLEQPLPSPLLTEPGEGALLRRWDSPGLLPVEVPASHDGWISLENGIEVRFEQGADYRSGDYWLIPARAATGDIEWPEEGEHPSVRPPDGTPHHYAPLALVQVGSDGQSSVIPDGDLRRIFDALARPA